MLAILSGLIVAFISGGCSLFPSQPYKEVYSFDIGNPKPWGSKDFELAVKTFKNESACKGKMLYREQKCQILIDDYNLWAQPPGFMLTRYIQMAFDSTVNSRDDDRDKIQVFYIKGNILAFEIDFDDQVARLSVVYEILRFKNNKAVAGGTRTFTAKYSEKSAEAFALAMSECAAHLVEHLNKEITETIKK
jgi:uncharacterized lipoprotein YmbA